MPPGCGCGDDVCEFSRIADSFEVQCLAQSPDILKSVIVTLCDIVEHGAIAPCPPCSDNPWVVLARVDLPAAPSTAIAASNIDNNTERRIVLSTTVLQEQLIACCCDTKSNSTVDLQSILVRRNGTTDPFQSSATLEAAHAPWDYQLTLTGQTPVDLPITITASNTTYVPNLTSPVTVPAGQSSLVVLNVPALLVVEKGATVKITALGKVNTSVATLNIPAGQIELRANRVLPADYFGHCTKPAADCRRATSTMATVLLAAAAKASAFPARRGNSLRASGRSRARSGRAMDRSRVSRLRRLRLWR